MTRSLKDDLDAMKDKGATVSVAEKPYPFSIADIRERLAGHEEVFEGLGRAAIILSPEWVGFNHNRWAFPQGTESFFKRAKSEAPDGVDLEIAATDDDYVELAQYHDWYVLPTLILAHPDARSFLVNLLSSYVYDLVTSRSANRQLAVRSKIVYEKSDEGHFVEWTYEGPAESFAEALKELSPRLNPVDPNQLNPRNDSGPSSVD